MAIPGGYRFTVPFDDVFPQGCYVIGVERASDHSNGKPKPAVDPISTKPVWAIQVTDPSAKGKNTGQVVKITADVQPVPPEAIPGTPFRPAISEDMSAVPYVATAGCPTPCGHVRCAPHYPLPVAVPLPQARPAALRAIQHRSTEGSGMTVPVQPVHFCVEG